MEQQYYSQPQNLRSKSVGVTEEENKINKFPLITGNTSLKIVFIKPVFSKKKTKVTNISEILK